MLGGVSDIALLHIDATELQPIAIAHIAGVVLAIGNPWGSGSPSGTDSERGRTQVRAPYRDRELHLDRRRDQRRQLRRHAG